MRTATPRFGPDSATPRRPSRVGPDSIRGLSQHPLGGAYTYYTVYILKCEKHYRETMSRRSRCTVCRVALAAHDIGSDIAHRSSLARRRPSGPPARSAHATRTTTRRASHHPICVTRRSLIAHRRVRSIVGGVCARLCCTTAASRAQGAAGQRENAQPDAASCPTRILPFIDRHQRLHAAYFTLVPLPTRGLSWTRRTSISCSSL